MIGIVLWILNHNFFFLTLTIHHMNLASPFFSVHLYRCSTIGKGSSTSNAVPRNIFIFHYTLDFVKRTKSFLKFPFYFSNTKHSFRLLLQYITYRIMQPQPISMILIVQCSNHLADLQCLSLT